MKTPPIKPQKKRAKLVKTVIRTLILVLIAAVIGINIYSLNASRLAGNSVPMPFGVGAAVVLSGSMEPELHIGDFILVVEQKEYEVGDWVVFQDGNMVVVHEVISINGEEITTQGVANDGDDGPIDVKYVKGKVVFYSTFLGKIVSFLKSPIGVILILAVAGWLIYSSYRAEKKETNTSDGDLQVVLDEINKLKAELEVNEEKSNLQNDETSKD